MPWDALNRIGPAQARAAALLNLCAVASQSNSSERSRDAWVDLTLRAVVRESRREKVRHQADIDITLDLQMYPPASDLRTKLDRITRPNTSAAYPGSKGPDSIRSLQ